MSQLVQGIPPAQELAPVVFYISIDDIPILSFNPRLRFATSGQAFTHFIIHSFLLLIPKRAGRILGRGMVDFTGHGQGGHQQDNHKG